MSESTINRFTAYISRLAGTVVSLAIFFFTSVVIAQDMTPEDNEMDETEPPSPRVEVLSNGELRITPTFESHASRIADAELLQSISNDPDSVIGKTLLFETGEVVGEIINLQRKVEDLFLYLVVDATPFFNADVTYAVAAKDIYEVREDVVLIPMAEGMHLRGFMYYPDEFVAHDENFSDSRVNEIFEEAPAGE